MIRLVRRGLAVILLTLGLMFAGVLTLHAWLQHQTARAVAIPGPYAIDEERFVRINGGDQWITIRGQDRRNPVLLILHGGPGVPMSYLLRQFQPLERGYVVVQWDQRGGGKTFSRNGGVVDQRIDMASMVSDGIQVSEYLRQHLHRAKIILVGHSFGSELGAQMAHARPDLFAAFVGTGVVARTQLEWQQWQSVDLAARMKAAGDGKGLAELRKSGPPPWADDSPQLDHVSHAAQPYLPRGLGHWGHVRAVLTAPHWSLVDVLDEPRGESGMLHSALWKPGVRDAYLLELDVFAVPVIIIQGSDDITSPMVFVHRWLDHIKAPAKALAIIPGQGHEVLPDDVADFTRALDVELSPILKGAAADPNRTRS
jgi:pimeloyl-ACP methyl ester carboxylesterase